MPCVVPSVVQREPPQRTTATPVSRIRRSIRGYTSSSMVGSPTVSFIGIPCGTAVQTVRVGAPAGGTAVSPYLAVKGAVDGMSGTVAEYRTTRVVGRWPGYVPVIKDGPANLAACRILGTSRKTGSRWLNGARTRDGASGVQTL